MGFSSAVIIGYYNRTMSLFRINSTNMLCVTRATQEDINAADPISIRHTVDTSSNESQSCDSEVSDLLEEGTEVEQRQQTCLVSLVPKINDKEEGQESIQSNNGKISKQSQEEHVLVD